VFELVRGLSADVETPPFLKYRIFKKTTNKAIVIIYNGMASCLCTFTSCWVAFTCSSHVIFTVPLHLS